MRVALLTLGAAGVMASRAEVTPVEKVITLLSDLKAQVEEEGKTEAGTYDKFACFCKDTTDEKSTDIKTNQDTIDSLSAEIVEKTADKEATQAQLKKDQKKLAKTEAELDAATKQYQADKAQYEATNAELTKAIFSLKGAIKSMKESKPSMAQMQTVIRKNVMVAEMLGMGSAKKAAAFLQTSVDPNDPEYKFHSNGIISMLEDLETEFETKKSEADKEYEKTHNAYHKFKKASEEMIASLETSIEEAQNHISNLIEEIGTARINLVNEDASLKDNKTYLADLTDRCEKRAQDWDQRSSLRKGEIEALTTALDIMESRVATTATASDRAVRNDINEEGARAFLNQQAAKVTKAEDSDEDMRDSMMVFTQTRMTVSKMMAHKSKNAKVVAQLEAEAARLGGSQMLLKAAAAVKADPFKKVKELIQDLIERLVAEATAETTKKGFCDTEMGKAEHERDFRTADVKKLNAELFKLEAKRDTLIADIAEANKRLNETETALSEATDLRGEEHDENTATIKDAKAGLVAVKEALAVLRDFYLGKNKAGGANSASVTYSLMQASPVGEDMAEQGVGAAKGAYQGAQGAAKNILGMLEVIATDFDRTARKTAEAEKAAQAEFVKFQRTSKASIGSLTKEVELKSNDLETTKSTIDSKMSDLEKNQSLLDSSLKTLEELKPMCVDMTMSYEERKAKREEEIAALKVALCQLDPEGKEAECSP